MLYRQTITNPFEDRADVRELKAAMLARSSEHKEFRHSVRLNRKKKQTLGHYTSEIMQVSFPYHSSLELAGMQWLDLQPNVRQYWPQPDTFHYEMDGELRKYTPDIGVDLKDGLSYMIEIKPKSDAERKSNRRRWRHIGPSFKQSGFGFAFLLDQLLQSQPLANHLRAIQRFKNWFCEPSRIWELQTNLDREDPWTIEEILPVLHSLAFNDDDFFGLVLHRHLYVDLRCRLDGSTPVWIPSRAPSINMWREYNAA